MENLEFNQRLELQSVLQKTDAIKDELSKIIIGQQHIVELMLAALLSDGHILMEGVPGVAKTLMSKLLAHSIQVQFKRIQFTPDLMPSDVLGTNIFNPQKANFEFRQGPIFSNIVLIDEINRAPAKTQAALFEVMEERQVTVDVNTYVMQEPFMVIATQNPVEHEGTFQLPEAQLDRFLFKINVPYPKKEEEVSLLSNYQNGVRPELALQQINKVIDANELKELRNLVKRVGVESHLIAYIVQLVHATRANPSIYLAASPRASIAILNASKAIAALRGRDFVTPEDIQFVAVPALRHRISLSPEKELEGYNADMVIAEIIKSNEIPR